MRYKQKKIISIILMAVMLLPAITLSKNVTEADEPEYGWHLGGPTLATTNDPYKPDLRLFDSNIEIYNAATKGDADAPTSTDTTDEQDDKTSDDPVADVIEDSSISEYLAATDGTPGTVRAVAREVAGHDTTFGYAGGFHSLDFTSGSTNSWAFCLDPEINNSVYPDISVKYYDVADINEAKNKIYKQLIYKYLYNKSNTEVYGYYLKLHVLAAYIWDAYEGEAATTRQKILNYINLYVENSDKEGLATAAYQMFEAAKGVTVPSNVTINVYYAQHTVSGRCQDFMTYKIKTENEKEIYYYLAVHKDSDTDDVPSMEGIKYGIRDGFGLDYFQVDIGKDGWMTKLHTTELTGGCSVSYVTVEGIRFAKIGKKVPYESTETSFGPVELYEKETNDNYLLSDGRQVFTFYTKDNPEGKSEYIVLTGDFKYVKRSIPGVYVEHNDVLIDKVVRNEYGGVYVRKVADGSISETTEGAVYGIYEDSKCKNLIRKASTVSDGKDTSVSYAYFGMLKYGTYYIKEISVPKGTHYVLDENVYKVTIKHSDGNYLYNGTDYGPVFNPSYYKSYYKDISGMSDKEAFEHFCKHGMKEERKGNGFFDVKYYKNTYSDLKGLSTEEAYKHFCDLGIAENRRGILVPDTKGAVYDSSSVSYQGEYDVVQSTEKQEFYLTPNLGLIKLDKAAGKSVAVGKSNLEGAEFTVCFYDKDPVKNSYKADPGEISKLGKPSKKWVFATKMEDEAYKLKFFDQKYLLTEKSDELPYKNGKIMLPVGYYTIEETKAPEDYLLDGKELYWIGDDKKTYKTDGGIGFAKVMGESKDNVTSCSMYMAADKKWIKLKVNENLTTYLSADNRQIRGDIEFIKKDKNTGEALPNVSFIIESKDTGEKVKVTTDENGRYSSSSSYAKHSYRTNDGNPGSGTWFFGKLFDVETPTDAENSAKIGNMLELGTVGDALKENAESLNDYKIDDDEGALPCGTYTLTECDNEGYFGIEPITFTITSGETIYLNSGIIENKRIPSIGTTASISSYDMKTKDITLSDIINYKDLLPNTDYYVYTRLINRADESLYKDADGKSVERLVKYTTGESKDGVITVDTSFRIADDTGYLVFYEEIYEAEDVYDIEEKDGIVSFKTYDGCVAYHKDLNNTMQTVCIPRIKTKAWDKKDGDSIIDEKGKYSIIDTVSCEGLISGRKYTLKGWLVNGETGEKIVVDGADVIAEKEITAEVECASYDMELLLNISPSMKLKKIVIFEELYDENSVLIAEHKDLNSKEQTIDVRYTVVEDDEQEYDSTTTLTTTQVTTQTTTTTTTETVKPDRKTPKTGDGFALLPIIIITMLSATGIFTVISIRKS